LRMDWELQVRVQATANASAHSTVPFL